MSADERNLISVYTTNNLSMIAVVKSILDNAQINYMVSNDNLQSVWPSLAWVDFLVDPADEVEAREVLLTVSESDNDSPEL